MNSESLPLKSSSGGGQSAFAIADQIPLTVLQAAVFLGVSPQTVYLWVERKQIPHLRVMGRNIRFLKSDSGPSAQLLVRRWAMAIPSVVLREKLKPATVHQELRILRQILNVAARKKLLPSNPCAGVEFPVAVKGLFRPHYVTWSEQRKIEIHAPEYLR